MSRAKKLAPEPALEVLAELRRIYGAAKAPYVNQGDRAWLAPCPACNSAGKGDWQALRVAEVYRGGPVRLICSGGCAEPAIFAALTGQPRDADSVQFLDRLAELAEAAARRIAELERRCRVAEERCGELAIELDHERRAGLEREAVAA